MIQLVLFSLLFAGNALAYSDGVYRCKNSEKGFPDQVYTVETIKLSPSANLPYVDVKRYIKGKNSEGKPVVDEVSIRGFAQVISLYAGVITLRLAALEFNFKEGKLLNCIP